MNGRGLPFSQTNFEMQNCDLLDWDLQQIVHDFQRSMLIVFLGRYVAVSCDGELPKSLL